MGFLFVKSIYNCGSVRDVMTSRNPSMFQVSQSLFFMMRSLEELLTVFRIFAGTYGHFISSSEMFLFRGFHQCGDL